MHQQPLPRLKESLTAFIATRTGFPFQEKDMNCSFSRLGLDSADHVSISMIIEDITRASIEPTIAFDYPTINTLMKECERLLQQGSCHDGL